MSDRYSVVVTTTDSSEKAKDLAKRVIEAKLAACVQILKIDSYFMWDGKLDEAAECLVLMKTRADLYGELEDMIKANHDYDVPEILQLPVIAGFADYLTWVNENTS